MVWIIRRAVFIINCHSHHSSPFFVVSQNLKICLDYLATTRARSTIIKLYLKGQRLKLDLSRYQITNIIFDFRREQKREESRGHLKWILTALSQFVCSVC